MPRLVRRVAPGVTELHSTNCARSTRGGRRCTCTPSYVAEARSHGQRLAKAFPTQDEALAWLIDVRAARLQGRLPELTRRAAPSLENHARDFLRRARAGKVLNRSRKRYAAATIEGYETALRLRVLDVVEPRTGIRLGDLRVDALDGRAAQRAVDEIAAAAGAARARTAGAALSAVLADAFAAGLRDEPPPRLQLPPPPPRRTRLVDESLLERLRAAAAADDKKRKRSLAVPLVDLLAATGLRVSELLALVWGPDGLDLDADPPTAHIAEAKTAAGVRDVLLDKETAAVMKRHRLATGRPRDGQAGVRGREGTAAVALGSRPGNAQPTGEGGEGRQARPAHVPARARVGARARERAGYRGGGAARPRGRRRALAEDVCARGPVRPGRRAGRSRANAEGAEACRPTSRRRAESELTLRDRLLQGRCC